MRPTFLRLSSSRLSIFKKLNDVMDSRLNFGKEFARESLLNVPSTFLRKTKSYSGYLNFTFSMIKVESVFS